MAPHHATPLPDILATSATGVMSMLKTTTDTGDIGALSFNKHRLPSVPRPAHRRRNNKSHLSDDSRGSFATSNRSRGSIRHARPFDVTGPRSSTTSLQTTKTAPSTYIGNLSSLPPLPNGLRNLPDGPSPAPSSQDGRAYSLSQTRYPTPLSMQRSISSLGSHSTAPRMPSQPFPGYSTRAAKPPRDYRPVSPAFSDYSGMTYGHHMQSMQHPGPHHMPPSFLPPPPTRPRQSLQRPSVASHSSDYVHPAPPPFAPTHPARHHVPLGPYMYQGPHPMVTADGYPVYPNEARAHPGLHSSVNPPMYPPAGRPRPSAPPTASTTRAYTPRTVSTPASSKHGSTTAGSSNPVTPIDPGGNDHAIINPAFIDPALTDLQDDGTETSYRLYTRPTKHAGSVFPYNKHAVAHELEGSPVVSPSGFVQRIKTLLGDQIPRSPPPIAGPPSAPSVLDREAGYLPVELPASNDAEDQSQVDVQVGLPAVRITREMVKSITSPSTSERDTTTVVLPYHHALDAQSDATTDEGQSNVAIFNRTSNDIEVPSTVAAFDSKPSLKSESQKSSGAKSDASTVTLTTFSHMTGMDQAMQLDAYVEQLAKDAIAARHTAPPTLPSELPVEMAAPEMPVDEAAIPVKSNSDKVLSAAAISPSDETGAAAKSTDNIKSRITSPDPSHSRPASTPPRITSMLSLQADTTAMSALGRSDYATKILLPPGDASAQLTRHRVPTASEVLPAEFFHGPPDDRLSTSLESIPPLQIKKTLRASLRQSIGEPVEAPNFLRYAFPRRQSVTMGETGPDKPAALDGECNRSSVITNKHPVDHMARLREESQEDIVVQSSMKGHTDGPPVTRNSSTSTSKPSIAPDDTCKEYPVARVSKAQKPGMSLSEIRDLPSLHFSQMDLVDHMNNALDTRQPSARESRSPKQIPGILSPSPIRPASTEALRERYTSFFNKPQEFRVPVPQEDTDSYSAEQVLSVEHAKQMHVQDQETAVVLELPKHSASEMTLIKSVGTPKVSEFQTEAYSPAALSPSLCRPLSPEEFLGIATDAARLSVPSVAGLSERLSELLPSIKTLNLNSIVATEEAVKHTIDEIQHLGERPYTTMSAHSSDGLRLMAAAAEDIVTHGTHDSNGILLGPKLDKDLPPLPEDTDPPQAKVPVRSNTTALMCPATPEPAMVRAASESRLSDEDKTTKEQILPIDLRQSGANDSTSGSRPWNSDENYPWSGDAITMDLGVARPATAVCHDSMTSEVLRQTRGSFPGRSIVSVMSKRYSTSSILSVSDLEPTATVTADTMTRTSHALGTATKTSVLRGSPIAKVKSIDQYENGLLEEANKIAADSSLSASLPHKPGDRYPSSALVSPFGVDLEQDTPSLVSETSSRPSAPGPAVDSIDVQPSSKKSSGLSSLKQRISGMPSTTRKGRGPPVITVQRPDSEVGRPVSGLSQPESEYSHVTHLPDPPAHARLRAVCMSTSPDNQDTASRSERVETPFPRSIINAEQPANAMGRVEFGVRAVSERLRLLMIKGGELIRTLTSRGRKDRQLRRQQEREQWLDDSIYS